MHWALDGGLTPQNSGLAREDDRNNRKGGTASLRSRTCIKRNAVFSARFKGLSLFFLRYQKGNLRRTKTGLDTYLICIQTRTPLSRFPSLRKAGKLTLSLLIFLTLFALFSLYLSRKKGSKCAGRGLDYQILSSVMTHELRISRESLKGKFQAALKVQNIHPLKCSDSRSRNLPPKFGMLMSGEVFLLTLLDVSDILYLFCSGEGKGESVATGRGGGRFFIENPRREGGGDGGGRGGRKGVCREFRGRGG